MELPLFFTALCAAFIRAYLSTLEPLLDIMVLPALKLHDVLQTGLNRRMRAADEA